MLKKETCPVCKGNKIVAVEQHRGAAKQWRTCYDCKGSGYHVRVVPSGSFYGRP
jgi:DnaJ-class molecular chaperone